MQVTIHYFMRRLFQRAREIVDPEIKIWVKWFSSECSRKDSQLNTFPEIVEILGRIPEKVYTRKEINKNSPLPEREFFIELFELKKPITECESCQHLTCVLAASENTGTKVDKLFPILAPILFQYMIRVMFHFPSLAEKSFDDPPSIEIMKTVMPLLHVMLKYGEQYMEDIVTIMGPLFSSLNAILGSNTASNRFETHAAMKIFVSDILEVFTMLTSEKQIVFVPVFEFYADYYVYWTQRYHSEHFTSKQLYDCTNITKILYRMERTLAKSIFKSVYKPLLNMGNTLMSYIFMTPSNSNPEQGWDLGYNYILFIKYVSELSAKLGEDISGYDLSQIIMLFVSWTLKMFPIISFEDTSIFDETEQMIISPEFRESSMTFVHDELEFITNKTFVSDVAVNPSLFEGEKHDKNIPFIFEGFDRLIEDGQQALDIMKLLISMCKDGESGENFVKSVIIATNFLAKNIYNGKVETRNPMMLCSSLILFCIQFLLALPSNIASGALKKCQGFDTMFLFPVFNTRYNLWTLTTNSADMGFYGLIRNYIYRLFRNCAIDNEDSFSLVLTAIGKMIEKSSPQMVDETINFLFNLFRVDTDHFVVAMSETTLGTVLVAHQMMLRGMQLKMIEEDFDPKFVGFVGQSRMILLNFFDTFTKVDKARYMIFKVPEFVKMLFVFLFEPRLQKYAIQIITRGLQLDTGTFDMKIPHSPFHNIFGNSCQLYKTIGKYINEPIWCDLMHRFLEAMTIAVSFNRSSLLDFIESYSFMEDISALPGFITSVDEQIRAVDRILRCYIPIVQAHESMRKRLAKSAMKKILDVVRGQDFGESTINLMLQLVFEREMKINKLPDTAEICNYRLIRVVHEATKHLPAHSKIFDYFAKVCAKSMNNRLQIFRSKMPIAILKYFQEFPSYTEASQMNIDSITALLLLFTTVSSFIFEWKTFYEAIQTMLPKLNPGGNIRRWQTDFLISAFTQILSPEQNMSSSFFHLDGKNTRISLPKIPGSYFSKGWSFMVRFELGSVLSGKNNTNPRLLSLVTTAGQKLELYFEERHLMLNYSRSAKRETTYETRLGSDFEPNRWFHVVMTVMGGKIRFYVDGTCRTELTMDKMLKLDKTVEGAIANSAVSSMVPRESPLTVNLVCAYLFSTVLPESTVASMAKLPMDFVYTFSPTDISLFPEIAPQSYNLFNENLNSTLVFCYNARMTADAKCANLAGNAISYATVKGQIIPFSADLRDVTANVGGLKTFLPLFEQVNLASTDGADGKDFFVTLIGLFVKFCGTSPVIQADFVKRNGLRVLAHLLSEINPDLYQKRTINQLICLWKDLDNDEFKLIMACDIWFNTSIWKLMSPEIRMNIIEGYESLFDDRPDIVLRAVTVGKLLKWLFEEGSIPVRTRMWSFLESVANEQFGNEDKELVYLAAFYETRDTVFRLEILDMIIKFTRNNTNDFNVIFDSHGYFSEAELLLSDPVEAIRMRGLELMLTMSLYYKHEKRMDSQKELQTPSISYAIRNTVLLYNNEEGTDKMWFYVIEQYFAKNDNGKMFRAKSLFPLVAGISLYYQQELIKGFLTKLVAEIRSFDETAATPSCSMWECSMWYFWTFYLLLQANGSSLEYDLEDDVVQIFGRTGAALLMRDEPRTKFEEMLGFIMILMESNDWDMSSFMRSVLVSVLQCLEKKVNDVPATSRVYIIQVVLEFIFYISAKEIFHENVELRVAHGDKCENPLQTEVENRPKIETIIDIFDKEVPKCTCSFSARIDKSGNWLDIECATMLMNFMAQKMPAEQGFMWAKNEQRVKFCDVYALLAQYLISCDISCVVDTTDTITKLLSNTTENVTTAVHLYASALYRAVLRDDRYVETFKKFMNAFPSHFARYSMLDPFSSQFVRDFNESHRDIVAGFLTTMSDRAVHISKAWNTRMEQTTRTTMSSFLNKMKTAQDKRTRPSIRKIDAYFAILDQEQTRLKMLARKECRHMFRELSSNTGPWSSTNTVKHWKLWKIYDGKFRRIYQKQNLKFDPHLSATRSTLDEQREENRVYIDFTDKFESKQEDPIDETVKDTSSFSFNTTAQLISIGASSKPIQGQFFMNNGEVYFSDDAGVKTVQFNISDIEMVLHRSYLHIDCGIEFFLSARKSFFFTFGMSKSTRNIVIQMLRRYSIPNIKIFQPQSGSISQYITRFTEEWVNRVISNYEYLMWLNLLAGRSFNDLAQYPVFPWILSNYTSEVLDLTDEKNYRDLSKPIGALNAERIENLRLTAREGLLFKTGGNLYRLHYSNPFYVLHYLVRMEPFTTIHIEMQDDKFDYPNRLFSGIGRSYDSVTSKLNDFRELIPEFFTLPDFLVNENRFDFGRNPITNEIVDDVTLPAWAKSPEEFISIHRQALESEYVSNNLHKWIDLIFGYAQTGQAAIDADNTFPAECYESCITREIMRDINKLREIQNVAGSIGITPKRLFTSKHPARKQASIPRLLSAVSVDDISVKHVMTSENSLCFMDIHGSNVYVVTSNHELFSAPLNSPKDVLFTCLGGVDRLMIMSGVEETTPSKSFVLLGDSKIFASSSLWDNSFHVFKLDGSTNAMYSCSYRQKYSLVSALAAGGDSKILVSWRDSSLTMWDLKDEESRKAQRPLFRISPHLTSLVDFDCDVDVGMIVSADKSRRVILSLLSTGQFVREFTIDSEDSLKKVMLFKHGHILLLSQREVDNRRETILRSYGLNGKKISEIAIPGICSEWCKCEEDIYGVDLIYMYMKDTGVTAIKMPMLEKLYEVPMKNTIVSMTWSSIHNGLYLADVKGEIMFVGCSNVTDESADQ